MVRLPLCVRCATEEAAEEAVAVAAELADTIETAAEATAAGIAAETISPESVREEAMVVAVVAVVVATITIPTITITTVAEDIGAEVEAEVRVVPDGADPCPVEQEAIIVGEIPAITTVTTTKTDIAVENE